MAYYCSAYCEHNADKVCGCDPCVFIRTQSGIIHEPGCALLPPEEGPTFVCPVCGMVSHNPNDVREGYCGNCHDWTGA